MNMVAILNSDSVALLVKDKVLFKGARDPGSSNSTGLEQCSAADQARRGADAREKPRSP